MERLINVLFVVAITLALSFAIFGLSSAYADGSVALLRKTTVMVDGASCSGSGSVVRGSSGQLYILTNAHVCNCAQYKGELFATMEGGELLKGRVVKRNWGADLCAARIDQKREALSLGMELLPFTEVATRGYPGGRLSESSGKVFGNTEWESEFTISEVGVCPPGSTVGRGSNGNISACMIRFTSTLTNLYARPGSSGSPVVNNQGQLVGVISSWHQDKEYDAGIVPFAEVRDFLRSL